MADKMNETSREVNFIFSCQIQTHFIFSSMETNEAGCEIKYIYAASSWRRHRASGGAAVAVLIVKNSFFFL